ncbi:hypothetical protein ACNKHR_04865 [Shigella flexneri]
MVSYRPDNPAVMVFAWWPFLPQCMEKPADGAATMDTLVALERRGVARIR